MGIAITLKEFLDAHGVDYRIVAHPHAPSANRTAEAAHVPGDHLAKAVLLEDDGHYLLAALPATRRLKLGRLHRSMGELVGLATEREVADLFEDCEPGAVPALGSAYGLETLLDDALASQEDIYIEAGDHESLVYMTGKSFRDLLGPVRHGDYSAHI